MVYIFSLSFVVYLQMRIHKRIINLHASTEHLKLLTKDLQIVPGVDVEVTIASGS
jgi:ribosomal protein S10